RRSIRAQAGNGQNQAASRAHAVAQSPGARIGTDAHQHISFRWAPLRPHDGSGRSPYLPLKAGNVRYAAASNPRVDNVAAAPAAARNGRLSMFAKLSTALAVLCLVTGASFAQGA